MKIERIVVGKGKSVPRDGPEGEWSKVYYQLEAVPAEGEDVQAISVCALNLNCSSFRRGKHMNHAVLIR